MSWTQTLAESSVVEWQRDGRILTGAWFSPDNLWRSGLFRFLPVPVLRSPSIGTNGAFTAAIGCLPNWELRVEASVDLKEWETVGTFTIMRDMVSMPFGDTTTRGLPHRFYRVLKQ
jgi:hypothetical protein